MSSMNQQENKSARRLIRALLSVIPLTTLVGCSSTSSSNPLSVFSPYQASVSSQPEEYRSPPASDARYTEPPSYPSHLLKPMFKTKEDGSAMLRRQPIGGGGGPGPMPGMGGY